MPKRVTIVLDDDLVKKLRTIQSKKITKSMKYCSFSRVINEELRKSLKQRNKMNELPLCTRCKQVRTSNPILICNDCLEK